MNKSQLTQKCKEIRDRNKYKYLNDEDKQFLLNEILPWHEEYKEKIGCGIDKITVELYKDEERKFSTWCYYLIRKDGTKIDFSYTHCIANKPKELCKKS